MLLITGPGLATGDAATDDASAAQTGPARQPERSQPAPARQVRDLLLALIAALALLTTGSPGTAWPAGGIRRRSAPMAPGGASVGSGRRRRASRPRCRRPTRNWRSHRALSERVAERELEQALMDRLQDTLLAFGHGVAFVGR